MYQRIPFCSLLVILLTNCGLSAQTIDTIIPLDRKMNETSGLEYFNGHFITHNDSGGEPELYEFDEKGVLLATHPVTDAKNKDWEDITKDQEFVYIGDHGNNFASREGLKIYKTKWNGSAFESVGKIRFRYGEQKNFNKRGMNAFDAEALTVAGDQLLLFSKNRKTKNTEVYHISKEPGDYVLYPKVSVPVNSLVTGADFHPEKKVLALVGYGFDGTQFLYRIQNFDPNALNFEGIEMMVIPHKDAQIEGVKVIDANHFWVTSEEEKFYGKPELIRISWE
ncbi:MAG: hypothetical protein ACON47_04930 [Flavobacteriaceae bacterium]